MQESRDELRPTSEHELVRRAQQGSHEAFADLLQRSKPRLWRAAMRILNSPEDAEDVLQNASWKAFTHLPGFRLDSSFNTWFTSIVVNQARMRIRELRRVRVVSIDDIAEDRPTPLSRMSAIGPTPEQLYASDELIRVLHEEIRLLPRRLRRMMQLYVADVTMPEAAEHLGLTVTATKTRMFRARHEFYSRMRGHLEIPAVPE